MCYLLFVYLFQVYSVNYGVWRILSLVSFSLANLFNKNMPCGNKYSYSKLIRLGKGKTFPKPDGNLLLNIILNHHLCHVCKSEISPYGNVCLQYETATNIILTFQRTRFTMNSARAYVL